MKEFLEIKNIGKLNIDKILFEGAYPILFTCINEKNEIFLCLCCQSNENGKKWLITKTTPEIIINILKDKLTLRCAFVEYPSTQISVLYSNNELQYSYNNREDWNYDNSRCLPDKNEYMNAEVGEFDEEIEYYTSYLNDIYFDIPTTLKHKFNIHSLNEICISDFEILIEGSITTNFEYLNNMNMYNQSLFYEKVESSIEIKNDYTQKSKYISTWKSIFDTTKDNIFLAEKKFNNLTTAA